MGNGTGMVKTDKTTNFMERLAHKRQMGQDRGLFMGKTSPVTQTTAYYSTKDHLVPPKSNILALNPKNNLKVIEIRHVNHCYFQEGYPSGYIAKLFEINH